MNLKLVTFKTNHTVLSEVEEISDFYKLKQPVQVIMQPTKEGPMIAFAPFIEFSEEFKTGIMVSKSDVLCATTPIRELQNQYNKMFGSGIEIASVIPKF